MRLFDEQRFGRRGVETLNEKVGSNIRVYYDHGRLSTILALEFIDKAMVEFLGNGISANSMDTRQALS